MTTTTRTEAGPTSIIRYVEGGDVCAACCDAVRGIALDGEIVTPAQMAEADAAVGHSAWCESDAESRRIGWCCDPRQSHVYQTEHRQLGDWIRPVVAGEDARLGDHAIMAGLPVVVADYAQSLESEQEQYPAPCLWWAAEARQD